MRDIREMFDLFQEKKKDIIKIEVKTENINVYYLQAWTSTLEMENHGNATKLLAKNVP